MTTHFISRALLSALLIATASSAMVFADHADARGRGGGGGAGGRPGGGGGTRQSVNHGSNNNFNRNTNVNRNTNINRNTNVNVNVNEHYGGYHGGYYGGGYYHPIATAAAITTAAVVTAAVVGSIAYSVPPSCVTTVVNGVSYSQCGSTWYQPRYVGSSVQYVVVNAP